MACLDKVIFRRCVFSLDVRRHVTLITSFAACEDQIYMHKFNRKLQKLGPSIRLVPSHLALRHHLAACLHRCEEMLYVTRVHAQRLGNSVDVHGYVCIGYLLFSHMCQYGH